MKRQSWLAVMTSVALLLTVAGLLVGAVGVVGSYRAAVAADESGAPFAGEGYDWEILGGVILVQIGLAIGAVSVNVRRRPVAEVVHDSGEVGSSGENWVLAGHVSGLFGILPVAVVYLLCRRIKGYPLEQARESLNFQLTVVLAAMLSLLLNGLLLPAIFVVGIILPFIAAIRVPRVAHYRYPVSLRLVH